QVEAYVRGTDLPAYQRLARAHGELLWARSPAPEIRTAVLFDEVDPVRGAGFTVPVDFRTDGIWVWTSATTYYLERHHLAPDPGLVAHVRARGYQRPELDGVDIHRALAALQASEGEEPGWVFDDDEAVA